MMAAAPARNLRRELCDGIVVSPFAFRKQAANPARRIHYLPDRSSIPPVAQAFLPAGSRVVSTFLRAPYLKRYRKSHSVELGGVLIAACAVAANTKFWTRNQEVR
jgi:hypothetical protein